MPNDQTPPVSGKTVINLPHTELDTFCVRYTGIINAQDYKDVCVDIGNAIIEKHGQLRMLIEYVDFLGWEDDAAELNLKTIFYQAPFATRLAYINPTERAVMKSRLILPPKILGVMRVYAAGELEEAVRWMKSNEPA